MPARRKDFDQAVALYGGGASIAEIAKVFDVSRQAMHKILSRRHVAFRPRVRAGADNHFFIHGQGYGPMKESARVAVSRAIASGRIVSKPCEKCGLEGLSASGRNLIQAHHDDYSKPLVVRWFCQKHHFEHHHPCGAGNAWPTP